MTHRRDGTTQMKQAQENEVGSSHRRIEQDWEAWRDPKVGCHQPPSPHNTLGLCEGAALTVGQARSKPLRERSRDGGGEGFESWVAWSYHLSGVVWGSAILVHVDC